MTTSPAPTVHASAVLIGARAVLIRGPAGSGKSRLALALIAQVECGRLRFARLVADDRTHVEAVNGRLLARAPENLRGLIEVRGLGIRRLPYESEAVVGLVVDLDAEAAERLPARADQHADMAGVRLPRIAVARGVEALPLVLAALEAQRSSPRDGKPESEVAEN
jgi:HPr kinase/phosphorylase